MNIELPEAEALLSRLHEALRPIVGADFALVGIHTGGSWIAQRLRNLLALQNPLGSLDIAFYRDDFVRTGLHAQVKPSAIPFDVEGRHIILVDDVLYTGRTVRAAMNELFDYGRPASIQLVVMVDRGGRELPIEAQVVGCTVELPREVQVRLQRGGDGRLSLGIRHA